MTRFRFRVVCIVFLIGVTVCVSLEHLRAQTSQEAMVDRGAVELRSMLMRRQKLIEQFGPDHPSVKKFDTDIRLLSDVERSLVRDVELRLIRQKLSGLNDQELREAVGVLISRVLELEEQVSELRRAPVRIELLGRTKESG